MGYCVDVNTDNFSFKKENAGEIFEAIKVAILNEVVTNKSWISHKAILDSETIEDMFYELRFEIYLDEDIYKMASFTGQKLGGYEEQVFEVIAPYVDDGYLKYRGEDGDEWKYAFINGVFYQLDNNSLVEMAKFTCKDCNLDNKILVTFKNKNYCHCQRCGHVHDFVINDEAVKFI